MKVHAVENVKVALEPISDIDLLEANWLAIDQQGNHSFFTSWNWIGSWLRSLPTYNEQFLLRATLDQETIGLAIITPKAAHFRHAVPIRQAWLNATGNPAYDCITIEHNGFASIFSEHAALWAALFDWFAASGTADELILPGIKNMPQGASSDRFLLVGRREVGLRTDIATESGDFRQRLTRNSRQQLSRATRRLQSSANIEVIVAHDVPTSLICFEKMKELHTQSWQRRGMAGAFENLYFENFCRELIRTATDTGTVQMMKVFAGEVTIGYLMNFLWRGTVYNYQSGLNDLETQVRPGYICHAFAIDYYKAKGAQCYDFLAKPNQLKRSFGSEAYELFWPQVRKRKIFFKAERFARKIFHKSEFG
jgi:CelD/BcsL family acetyltransferase involved in cellulose biosynthesis